MGKTCELCFHARELLQTNNPVIFFQGLLLEFGISTAVAEEFNWTFSEQQSPIELFNRLDSILKGRSVIVLVDGIDEWQYPQKVQNLVNFVRHANRVE